MKTKLIYTFFFFLYTAIISDATGQSIVWQKTIGGNDKDSMTAFCLGTNNTFIVCGASKSNKSGSKSLNSIGGYDYWVVKMDYSGNIIWEKTFGGKKDDIASSIIATSDGGYLVGGSSISDKGGSKTTVSFKKSYDYWILKLDANGNQIWDKTYGGIFTDRLTALTELSSGKYVAGGYSFSDSLGSKTKDDLGSENTGDYWILVLDKNGNLLSQNVFGGTSMDVLTAIAPASANSVYVAGYSYSIKCPGYKTLVPVGNNDYWLVRSDFSNTVQYEGDFGGSRSDYLTCMQTLSDNSLIIGGYSNSPASGSKSEGFLGVTDFWLVKLKPDGTKQWDKTIGGSLGDYLVSVQQTKDKGFVLGGYSNSNTGNSKTQNSKGGYDYWIVKTDSLGNKLWDKTIGGSGNDIITGVYEIGVNQYIVAGTSSSVISGDKTSGTVGNTGASDYWVLRISSGSGLNKNIAQPLTSLSSPGDAFSFSIVPNPVKNILTLQYKTEANKQANFVVYAANGNAVLKTVLPSSSTTAVRSFSVANLNKGAYYAVMYVGDKKISKVFVKE